MTASRLTPPSSTSAQTKKFPGIPVNANDNNGDNIEQQNKQQQDGSPPRLESFPQPVFSSAQEDLQKHLLQNPHPSSDRRQQQPARDLRPRTSEMGSDAQVPKHLNFITGNKNKLAEVCV